MENLIKCPSCGHEFEASEVLTSQIKEETKLEIEKNLREKIKGEARMEIEDLRRALREKEEKVEESRERELRLREEKRKLEDKEKELELEVQRRVDEEKKKVEEVISKQAAEDHRLKDLEKDKKISDMEKLVEELKRKAQQGSMQTQGEVMELDLEKTLRTNFTDDEIVPIGKGEQGADIRQIVKSPRGTICGVILWESKRTKAWSDSWINKLKDDLRKEGANLPVIVSDVMPKDINSNLGPKDGVWITTFSLVIPLAILLRKTLLDSMREKVISQNRQSKATELYDYITGHEFAQQVETMVEAYLEMKNQIARERTLYERQWAQREMQVNRLLSGVAVIYGSMQGIAGTALPQIKTLELESGEQK